jgi:hypothetical protein
MDGMVEHGELSPSEAQQGLILVAAFAPDGKVVSVKPSSGHPVSPLVEVRLPLLKSFPLTRSLGRACEATLDWRSTCAKYE